MIKPGLLLFAFPFVLTVQAPANPPSCSEDLESLKSTVETDYAGYLLEVKPAPARYDRAISALRARAASAKNSNDCFVVLRDYIRWYDDPHLFLYQNPPADSAAVAQLQSLAAKPLGEAQVREFLDRNRSTLDPIEGIWYDAHGRIGVVRNGTGKHSFIAVQLASDSGRAKPGTVIGRFVRKGADKYDADLVTAKGGISHPDAQIHKRVLLRLSPGIWGKAYPVRDQDKGLLHPADPHRATFIKRGRTSIVSIPSHSPEYRSTLDSIVAEHGTEIQSSDKLIVDLRGNEGGSSMMTGSLMPYIASHPQAPSPLDFRQTLLLSSPHQIAYARGAFGPDTDPAFTRMMARMEANQGKLVPLFDSLVPPSTEPPDSVINGPRRVGLLIDRGTVSASEVMVLEAMRSSRVTVFGEPTAGALDYQTTRIIWFSPTERRWGLGYPTQVANSRIPREGMRGKGIQPQVKLNLSVLDDPLATVERLLK
jgi:hypothetical protein